MPLKLARSLDGTVVNLFALSVRVNREFGNESRAAGKYVSRLLLNDLPESKRILI